MRSSQTTPAGGTGARGSRSRRAAEADPELYRRALDPGVETGILETRNLSLWYGRNQALDEISIRIPAGEITALIGPSGCGKSTFLRCFNRLNDLIDMVRIEGSVRLDGEDLYRDGSDVNLLRSRVGMVFQKSNPFPKSIFENVAYGLRIQGINSRAVLEEIVERSLRRAALWGEVKDRLGDIATGLSGGQQQRLCIARTIAVEPEVVLYDEPCSALDPLATARIEELMLEFKSDFTQVIVTHNLQQASRISDYTAFMYLGELVEYGRTEKLFLDPTLRETEAYITGRFG